jgi:hypothetical protein
MTEKSELSFWETFLGLVLNPRRTTQELCQNPSAALSSKLALCTLLILIGPIIGQLLMWDFLETRASSIFALILLVSMTASIFIVLEYLLLQFLKVRMRPSQLVHIYVYACVPLAILALCYYLLDFAYSGGRLTLTTFLITGIPDAEDRLLFYFPALHLLAKLFFLYIFFSGLSEEGNLQDPYAVALTLLSSLPFYLALFASAGLLSLLAPEALKGAIELALALEFLL